MRDFKSHTLFSPDKQRFRNNNSNKISSIQCSLLSPSLSVNIVLDSDHMCQFSSLPFRGPHPFRQSEVLRQHSPREILRSEKRGIQTTERLKVRRGCFSRTAVMMTSSAQRRVLSIILLALAACVIAFSAPFEVCDMSSHPLCPSQSTAEDHKEFVTNKDTVTQSIKKQMRC